MLELRELGKRFLGIPAVEGVTFSARAGEITGYLGPNGSGKSTTMKMIAGIMEPGSGQIFFDGRPIRDDLIAYKQRLGYVPEEPHLYGHLSGLEYLIMVGQLRNLPAKPTADRIDGLLRLLALHSDRHAPISAYSKGMRQKVLLTAALMHNPDLLLLDEPFSGLDVGTGLVLRSLIQEMAARGKVVLFSSHELETVERLCSHVVILHRARVVADDSIERLRILMAAPTLEGIFSQLTAERGYGIGLARDRRPDRGVRSLPMMKQQFRVLYREFLFRMVDLELLSSHAQGDMSRLFGQFASLLIFLSLLFTAPALGMSGSRAAAMAGRFEHFLIATTMLVVGLFAVLSWDASFPDRRDVLVLAPLPVRARTIFLAKVAGVAASLGLTVLVLHSVTGLVWPLALNPGGFVGLIRSYAVLVTVYFLEPARAAWSPATWFVAFFEQLNGSPAPAPLAYRAWIGLGTAAGVAAVAYALSYFRMLRRIVEEQDIAPAVRGTSWLPRSDSGRPVQRPHAAAQPPPPNDPGFLPGGSVRAHHHLPQDSRSAAAAWRDTGPAA